MRRIFLTLSLILLLSTSSYSQEISGDISGLSIEECLTLALMNHPSLRRAGASTQSIAAQLESLRAAKRVKVSLTGSARYNGDYEYWDDRYHNESLGLSATKLLYDTGRNRLQQEIRRENLRGSRETERNTQVTVAANAKRKYYDLVLKFLNSDVEQEKLRNY